MKRFGFGIMIVLLVATFTVGLASAGDKVLTMSTTTSTQASGLLDLLLPEFAKDTGIRVKVIAKGTGAAIRDGMDGNVDVIFVHALKREQQFVADGYGTKRYGVMHNDFVILGPPADPAGIKGMKDAAGALKKIAASGAAFISRGDDSGTHTKEQALWRSTGLALEDQTKEIVKKGKKSAVTFTSPKGSQQWYRSIGQGMGKCINFADEKGAYTLADRGTYLKYKFGRTPAIELDVLSEGDGLLANPYGVIPIDPKKHSHVKHDMAKQFAQWLTSPKGQRMIADYRLLEQPLFYPDAL